MADDPLLGSRIDAALSTLAASVKGPSGPLSGKLGGSEMRPGQFQMARAVARAVGDKRPLVVRAGTGTGKTWAYLVGALAAGGDRRVLVATATRALQDQLAGKDLPAVAASGVRPGLTWAVLKGRSNYLCRQAAAEAGRVADAPTLGAGAGGQSSAIGGEVARLLAWGATSGTGDRAELDFEPRPAAWSSVSVGSEECPGAVACPSGRDCFAEAAYQRAREADVVVVNLHLLGAHVASGGHVLPEHDVVVIDEAHETEDVLSGALGVTLTPGRVAAVIRLLPGSALHRHRDAVDRVLAPLAGRRLPDGAAGEPPLAEALGDLAQALRNERSALRGSDGADPDGKARGERAAKALESLAADVDTALRTAAEEMVTWVEQAGSQPVLRVAPIDVGNALATILWSSATPVLTSATVPPGLGARLGLRPETVDLDIGSPFDYRTQALLYVPRLPDVRHPDHEAAAHAELGFLVGAAGGRTLALFTSWRAMRAARAALDGHVPYRLLAQDDLPKPALVEAFRADETSCLFATMGFWQGVDVPGATCSLVVIDRLPFARPDDPLAEARRERAGADAFTVVDVPHAAVRLAQGAGRLIRSATDRGVVAVLDRRLAEASYRPAILAALPPMRRTRDRADVTAFFDA